MTSQELSNIIKTFRSAVKDYEYHIDQLKWYEDQAMDFQHFFELENLTYKERARLATRYTKNRKERRVHKDYTELLYPIAEMLKTDCGIKMIRCLEAALGEIRKVEKKHKHRTYKCRTERDGELIFLKNKNTGGE